MAGVFVSYARADQRLARRIHNALSSLELDVLWDENMPSVRWREYIESNIRALDAVLVLWTEDSSRSPAVLDEALEAYSQKKLINSMHGIKEPPAPFNKINAAKLDGWEAGKPHAGWEKVVATLDGLLAPIDEGKKPGGLIARYKLQLSEVRDRRALLAEAEREGIPRKRRHDKASKDCIAAEDQLHKARREADAVVGMGASSKVVAAAMAAAQQEIDEAQAALNVAKDRLSEIEAESEQAEYALEEKRKNLAGYLVMIGGDTDGSVVPEALSNDPPGKGAEPDPKPVPPTPEPAPPPPPPVPPVRFKETPTPLPIRPWWKSPVAMAGGVLLLLVLVAWASGLFSPSSKPEVGVEAATEEAATTAAEEDAAAAASEAASPYDAAKAQVGWLLNDKWAVIYRGNCVMRMSITLSDDGSKLNFSSKGGQSSEAFKATEGNMVVTTETTEYASDGKGSVTMRQKDALKTSATLEQGDRTCAN